MFDFVFYQLNLFYEKREKGSDTIGLRHFM